MIECSACHTLNPDGEAACLVCGSALAAVHSGQPARMRCAAGHPIDPSWRTCPYCDRLRDAAQSGQDAAPGESRGRTRHDSAGAPAAGGTTAAAAAGAAPPSRPTHLDQLPTAQLRDVSAAVTPPRAGAKPTRLEMPAIPATPRHTVLTEAPVRGAPSAPPAAGLPVARPAGEVPAPAAAPGAASDGRRLVAVLAAPHLQPGGAVFPVRAGKNTLGASRTNDICLAQDHQVSGEHAILLYRGGSFMLADRMSSNGTWVNDREVPANGSVEIRDRDRIRCGGVELLLLALETAPVPPAGAESPH
jgi:hypothetical protein